MAKYRRQYGALPIRTGDQGLEVLLVTSRSSRRWIIPKGWPEKRLAPRVVAAMEAFEEAGVIGRARTHAFRTYRYRKRLKEGKQIACEVEVYLFDVAWQFSDWPERGERELAWFAPAAAAALVEEPGLSKLLLSLGALIREAETPAAE
jgi:8-oxo-dGTP pyrophosphatase MutT (NUDIX family)